MWSSGVPFSNFDIINESKFMYKIIIEMHCIFLSFAVLLRDISVKGV